MLYNEMVSVYCRIMGNKNTPWGKSESFLDGNYPTATEI